MRNNKINSVMKNVTLPEDAKKRIKNACTQSVSKEKKRICNMRFGMRAAIAAAVLAAMSITAYAAVDMGYFFFEKNDDDDTVIIGATLPDEVRTEIATEPVRAWNPGDGEISVKLEFAYMPEDMSERDNTPAKWHGTADYNRSITFVGYDLRRSDFESVLSDTDDVEHFMAGANDAYLLTSDSEIFVYDKTLYVLFYDGQFVVSGYVGEGITEEEIKAIAAGMSVVETDDVEHALPISNEFDDSDDTDTKVYYRDPIIVKGSELLSVGDTAEYSSIWEDFSVTPLGFEIVDRVAGLDKDSFHNFDWVEQFIDENGNFIPYKRTGVDYESGKFTETVEVTKRMVLVTVQFDSDTELPEHDIWSHLNTFQLKTLEFNDDGTVNLDVDNKSYVIDRTPGRRANSSESKYIRSLGDGRWVIGYILDEECCEGDFFYCNTVAKMYYSFER